MNIMILVSIITFVLGVIALILVVLNYLRSYKTTLIVGALVLFALSITTYLIGQNNASISSTVESTPTKASTEVATTEQQEDNEPISPLSPISPISTPEPVITEVEVSEIGFEGCLLFVSNRSGDIEIFEVQQEVDIIHQLTDSPGLDIEPSWSPDGTQIAFVSNREPDTGLQLYLMRADGSEQQMLGPVQPGDNSHPSWSPDGSQIVFQSKRDTNGNGFDDNSDLYLMNADGSEITLLVFHSAEDAEPVWSPDGKYIAFISERSGRDEVHVMSPDGSNITQITDLNVLKTTLNWSGDSQSLLFEGSGDIYAVDVETKEVTKVIGLKNSNESTPVWAQAKDHIIFSSDQTSNWNLYLADRSAVDQLILAPLTDGINLNRSTSWFPCQ